MSDQVLGDAQSARVILQAHDKAAQEAATAAAFMRLGESVKEAVQDAEIVWDAPSSVDQDCALVSRGSGTASRQQQVSEGPRTAPLGTAPLVSPSLECVKDALESSLTDTTFRPSMPLYPDQDGAASIRDSIVSCVGSMTRPESCTADEDEELEAAQYTTTAHGQRAADGHAIAGDAALLSMAAHVLGLSEDRASAADAIAPPPAVAVGGTGMGAHSGGDAAGVHVRVQPCRSPPLPHSPHPSNASQDSSLARVPSGGLARSNSTPQRAGSSTPGRSRPPPGRTSALVQASALGQSALHGVRHDAGEYSGSAPSSVSGYPVTPSGSGVGKRPPTPPPGRLNTTLSNRARSSASSYRSGTSSPLHSARLSHTSLDELWAVEEEDNAERATSLVGMNGGSDVMGVLSERDSEGEGAGGSVDLPPWYTHPTPPPGGMPQDEVSNLTTRGSSLTSASPRGPASLRDEMSQTTRNADAEAAGVAATVSSASTAPATPPARDVECGHTGIPLLDEEPALVKEVQDIQEQIVLHGYVNRAAALAGALVHAGHHSVAQASNLAEGAMDTADVVDFVDATTNLDRPDTVPDLVTRQAEEAQRDQGPLTPHTTPALSLSRQASEAQEGASSALHHPSDLMRQVDAWCAASTQGLRPNEARERTSAFAAGPAPHDAMGAMAALCAELSGPLLSEQPSGTPENPDLSEDTPAKELYGYQAHGAHLCEDVHEPPPGAPEVVLSPHGQEVARVLPQRLDSELGGVTPAPSTAAVTRGGTQPFRG